MENSIIEIKRMMEDFIRECDKRIAALVSDYQQERLSVQSMIDNITKENQTFNDKLDALLGGGNYSRKEYKEPNKPDGREVIRIFLPMIDSINSSDRLDDNNYRNGLECMKQKCYNAVKTFGQLVQSSEGTEYDTKLHKADTAQPTLNKEMHHKIQSSVQVGFRFEGDKFEPIKEEVVVYNYDSNLAKSAHNSKYFANTICLKTDNKGAITIFTGGYYDDSVADKTKSLFKEILEAKINLYDLFDIQHANRDSTSRIGFEIDNQVDGEKVLFGYEVKNNEIPKGDVKIQLEFVERIYEYMIDVRLTDAFGNRISGTHKGPNTIDKNKLIVLGGD